MAETIQPMVSEALMGVAKVEVVDCNSQIGSGALPTDLLASAGLSISPEPLGHRQQGEKPIDLAVISKGFRSLALPVIGKLSKGMFVLDLRCLETPGELIDQLSELRQAFEHLS